VIEIKRTQDASNEQCHLFLTSPLSMRSETSLAAIADRLRSIAETTRDDLEAIQASIDEVAFNLYGFDDNARECVTQFMAEAGSGDLDDTESGDDSESAVGEDFIDKTVPSLISHLVGTCLGRWDIGYATGERQPPELPDPFGPLPVCPPGMLQNANGMPAERKDVPDNYPLAISWPGILVDDKNHPEDIVARVREAIDVVWPVSASSGSLAEATEQEACEILGVKTLRDYFRRPAAFFADHLKRYSKSRRKAPIYWPLSTKSGSYTLWLYYHRLSDQTLYSAVNDFVEPKLKQLTEGISHLRAKANRSSTEEKDLERLSDLELELRDFRDELLRIARFWKPNLNDGVQITAAPLWRLFQLSKWQKILKVTWEKLEAGDYDWAHLSLSIWPDRVVRASHADRSYAIAHNLEDRLWHEVEVEKKGRGGRITTKIDWQPRQLSEDRLNGIITEVESRQ